MQRFLVYLKQSFYVYGTPNKCRDYRCNSFCINLVSISFKFDINLKSIITKKIIYELLIWKVRKNSFWFFFEIIEDLFVWDLFWYNIGKDVFT